MSEQKLAMKVRLARKHSGKLGKGGDRHIEDAYVAGFDHAKAICLDFARRFIDKRVDPPFCDEELEQWAKRFSRASWPSVEMEMIGGI